MIKQLQVTKPAVTTSTTPSTGGDSWINPNNILVDDNTSSTLAFTTGGNFGALLVADGFDFKIPDSVVIDGIALSIDGSETGCTGTINIGLPGSTSIDLGTLNTTYGGNNDLWGLESISHADLADIEINISVDDLSGGDGIASIDYLAVTVHYHIDLSVEPTEVPTRFAYKVYSREGTYLGELPDVSTPFVFSQDINSAGSTLNITCGKFIDNATTTDTLLTEDLEDILTEGDLPILATATSTLVAKGASDEEAIYKNSNRVQVIMYNYWHPNGKLVFSGQINRVSFQYGTGNESVTLTVFSDGVDLVNYIARGLSGDYVLDQSELNTGGSIGNNQSASGPFWRRSGQTFTTGAGVTNIGAISLMLRANANVTINVFDAPNGNLLGSTSKRVDTPGFDRTEVQFAFPQLIEAAELTQYFFDIRLQPGQNLEVQNGFSIPYSGGECWLSQYDGGGGGAYEEYGGNLWFKTFSGTLVTTTTYVDEDPTIGMMRSILNDYVSRGGYITERNFETTGLELTYTFSQATIFDGLRNVLEMSPAGFYSFIDLGTAQMDILQISDSADFTVVRGKDVNALDVALTIESVKNTLLFTGGEISTDPSVNLFKYYQDSESAAFYGTRMATKTDNRVVLDPTANAVGSSFIDESSKEEQETSVTVLNTSMDISLLTPGKTLGFRSFTNFIDSLVLQIVRRDVQPGFGAVKLTLGRLPLNTSLEVQRINRELQNEQTVNNPDQPD